MCHFIIIKCLSLIRRDLFFSIEMIKIREKEEEFLNNILNKNKQKFLKIFMSYFRKKPSSTLNNLKIKKI